MHLIPPDSSQEECISQMAHSLRAFQLLTDQTFQKAAQRVGKCRQRMEGMGKRLEVLEKKMDAMEELPGVPLLHCAFKYPDVGTPGRFAPVFPRLPSFRQPMIAASEDPSSRDPLSDPQVRPTLADNPQFVKDAFFRKQNPPLIFRKNRHAESVLFNADKLAKLNREEPASSQLQDLDLSLLNFGNLINGSDEQGSSSSKEPNRPSHQLDFSESLLDLCPNTDGRARASAQQAEMGNDPFAYEPVEHSELADFDLPEDLPGMDVKSVAMISRRMPSIGGSKLSIASSNQQRSCREGSNKSPATETKDEAQTSHDIESPLIDEGPSKMISPEEQQPIGVSEAPHAPPPPPPPPPIIPQISAQVNLPQESGRSDLMAAIRAAGGVKGAKLKKVEVAEEEKKAEEKEAKMTGKIGREEPAEDLMSSLAKALEMRRKGISGKAKAGPSGTNEDQQKRKKSSEPFAVLRERIPRIREGSAETEEKEEDERAKAEWD